MKPEDVRAEIVRRLEVDLVGPLAPDEVLKAVRVKPSDVYLSGILWPIGERMGAEDDDGSTGDDEEDEAASSATVVGQQRPCTMGISFATSAEGAAHGVEITIRFATYTHSQEADPEGRTLNCWTRHQHEFMLKNIILPEGAKDFPKPVLSDQLDAAVEVHIRSLPTKHGLLTTVTLINRSKPQEPDSELIEKLTLFQTEITVRAEEGTRIVARPPAPVANDEDEKSNRLLYRKIHDFAAGHQCSVSWESDGDSASVVKSTWLPRTIVPAFKEDGDSVFAEMIAKKSLDAEALSVSSDAELSQRLTELTDAYEKWIKQQSQDANLLSGELKETANGHLDTCRLVCFRMKSGIDAIGKDKNLRDSFRLANAAMAIQHKWKKDPGGNPLRPLAWRPFQLGFILLAAESACHINSEDREILDLLWFPTGGGKTEAYLTIIAMLAWYRRLNSKNPDDGNGNAAVMRYTLRLLTAQQFERAASMILACELLRRGKVAPRQNDKVIGNTPFSIGLWVGRDATPNKFDGALQARGQRDGSTAEQIEKCPCCQKPVRWNYDEDKKKVSPFCETPECDLGPDLGHWPVFTVDEDIYREKPTLVIGTVDKFAQLPFKPDVASLFGFGSAKSTDLIIQDELHLISGPLGTITGLYETAFDWLLRKAGRRPKVIGSTATIRRAEQQVRALFDRQSCQFPPPGISYENSGFAVVDEDRKWRWRMYVGVTTAGRSAKFALQATAGSVLQSGGAAPGNPDNLRDGYATLLCYFNSLRELGGAIVQMLDDVPDSISLYSGRRGEFSRPVSDPKELTSRVSQREIIEILGELKRSAGDPDCVDVVLATNMVSVGVDVPRLGLMIVNGQPKTRSEYIQSTSRVGRSDFPGLVISVLNASKARDRSHYETYPSWHGAIYRDVEATSVTPFASRARDRALRAVLVSMIRHSDPHMSASPNLNRAPHKLLKDVVDELERRIAAVDARELNEAGREIDDHLDEWDTRNPTFYMNPHAPNKSLLQYAEDYAKKVAAGRLPGAAWPTMNTMRSVEPSSRFRMAEILTQGGARVRNAGSFGGGPEDQGTNETAQQPRWRKKDA